MLSHRSWLARQRPPPPPRVRRIGPSRRRRCLGRSAPRRGQSISFPRISSIRIARRPPKSPPERRSGELDI